jgi:hypothetical protein
MENPQVSKGQWPDRVDFPVRFGTLRKGDTCLGSIKWLITVIIVVNSG